MLLIVRITLKQVCTETLYQAKSSYKYTKSFYYIIEYNPVMKNELDLTILLPCLN